MRFDTTTVTDMKCWIFKSYFSNNEQALKCYVFLKNIYSFCGMFKDWSSRWALVTGPLWAVGPKLVCGPYACWTLVLDIEFTKLLNPRQEFLDPSEFSISNTGKPLRKSSVRPVPLIELKAVSRFFILICQLRGTSQVLIWVNNRYNQFSLWSDILRSRASDEAQISQRDLYRKSLIRIIVYCVLRG